VEIGTPLPGSAEQQPRCRTHTPASTCRGRAPARATVLGSSAPDEVNGPRSRRREQSRRPRCRAARMAWPPPGCRERC
jgi:hypothetical protein